MCFSCPRRLLHVQHEHLHLHLQLQLQLQLVRVVLHPARMALMTCVCVDRRCPMVVSTTLIWALVDLMMKSALVVTRERTGILVRFTIGGLLRTIRLNPRSVMASKVSTWGSVNNLVGPGGSGLAGVNDRPLTLAVIITLRGPTVFDRQPSSLPLPMVLGMCPRSEGPCRL